MYIFENDNLILARYSKLHNLMCLKIIIKAKHNYCYFLILFSEFLKKNFEIFKSFYKISTNFL